MRDRSGKELAVGDWVKVRPPGFAADLTGHLFSETARPGVAFEAPAHLGTVVARVASLRVTEDGVLKPDHLTVTWLALPSGSQRSEDVNASCVLKLLAADGSEPAEGPSTQVE